MSVWFALRINSGHIGTVEIRRTEYLDLSDKAAIQDVVSTYEVKRDDVLVGTVEHRYGDGAWRLVSLACDLVARADAPHRPAPGGGFVAGCGWCTAEGHACPVHAENHQARLTAEGNR